MPIYEYRCDSCGTKFEKLMRGATDRDGLRCPDCGELDLSQQFSTFAARANGSAAAAAEMPSCPSGMCSNPSFCGRN